MSGFEGRVALVTGAAGGIGEALVRLLAEAGCTVVATERETPHGGDTRVRSLALDVTDSAAVGALVDRVESGIGPDVQVVVTDSTKLFLGRRSVQWYERQGVPLSGSRSAA